MSAADDKTLNIGGRSFDSRLLVGTGKFASPHLMRDALDATGGEIVTVALRRADLSGANDPFANILEFIDPKKFLILPNTCACSRRFIFLLTFFCFNRFVFFD